MKRPSKSAKPPTRPSRRTPAAARKPRARPAAGGRTAKTKAPGATSFPIVGIGASAGGLEAFTQLLGALPMDTGLAFVLVQHLDPKHESMLTTLLSHATTLPIHEARDGMRIEANHIYVIPPNTNLAVLHGRLSLMPRTEERGQHMPVDFFFRSLAADQESRAIGVILSGTASDGTEGLRAIKAGGGLTFAQDEKSAKYDGMPHSARAAGVVDFVLPPEGIARELAHLVRHPYVAVPAAKPKDPLPQGDEDLNRVFILLRSASGVDFSLYKPTTLKRRVARRMVLHKIESLAHYVRFLKQTPGEVEALFEDVLINVTSFFREPEAFEALKKRVFPRMLEDRPRETPIRVWVPGCSTGEEAYSIPIALLEFLSQKGASVPVQIFASDISEPALEKARAGIYPAGIAADVSAGRLRRFFALHDAGFQISKPVRDLCVFARQDVTKDPPFSKLDLISCRNLLIYLGSALQKPVLQTFHYALKPGGHLLLGGSETIGGFAELFALIDRRNKLYARKPAEHRMDFELPRPSHLEKTEEPGRPAPAQAAGFDYQREADRIVLGKYAPPGVLVNDRLDILQFRGHTGPYLEPASGAASFNLLKMAREGLLVELRTAVNEAKRRKAPVRRTGVQVKSNGAFREVVIEAIPLRQTLAARAGCYLVLFEETRRADAPETAREKAAISEAVARDRFVVQLQQELTATKEYLQSTNEELETAKEELQSGNEELTTVNEGLHTRNAELDQANGDLVNLLSSVQIPIVILGRDLRIRRFTPVAARALNLIPSDVGRPLSDLRPNVLVPDFEQLIAGVMDSLTPKEAEVQDREGRWHLLRIRPYKTLENKIEGVILALVEIETVRRTMMQQFSEAIVATVRQPLLVLDGDLRVKTAHRAFREMFQVRLEETENRLIYQLGAAQWDLARLRELLEEILPKDRHFEGFEVDAEFPGVGRKKLLLDACRLVGGSKETPCILLAMEEAKAP